MKHNLQVAAEVLNPELASLEVSQSKERFMPQLAFEFGNDRERVPSYSWIEASEQVRTIGSDYSAAISQFIPTGGTLSLSFLGYETDTSAKFQTINPRYGISCGFSFKQPLLKDFGFQAARKDILVAQNTRSISENELKKVLLQTVSDVEAAYWNLVCSREILQVKEQSLKLAQDLLEKNRKEVEIGTIAPKEILSAEAEVAARRADILQAQMEVLNASDALQVLINLPEEGVGQIIPIDKPAFAERKVTLDECWSGALEDRPDLRAAKFDLKNKDIEVGYSKNQLLPALNFEMTYRSPGVSGTRLLYLDDNPLTGVIIGRIPGGASRALRDAFNLRYNNWSFVLTLDIPVGSIVSRAALTRAKVSQDQALLKAKSLEQQSFLEVKTAVRAVQTDYERVRAYQVARELAERKLAAEEAKLKAGMSTNFVVLQYQRDLANASMAELKAVIDYNVSLSRLDMAVGTSLEKWNIRIADLPSHEAKR